MIYLSSNELRKAKPEKGWRRRFNSVPGQHVFKHLRPAQNPILFPFCSKTKIWLVGVCLIQNGCSKCAAAISRLSSQTQSSSHQATRNGAAGEVLVPLTFGSAD
jgi:hypothetical protein